MRWNGDFSGGDFLRQRKFFGRGELGSSFWINVHFCIGRGCYRRLDWERWCIEKNLFIVIWERISLICRSKGCGSIPACGRGIAAASSSGFLSRAVGAGILSYDCKVSEWCEVRCRRRQHFGGGIMSCGGENCRFVKKIRRSGDELETHPPAE